MNMKQPNTKFQNEVIQIKQAGEMSGSLQTFKEMNVILAVDIIKEKIAAQRSFESGDGMPKCVVHILLPVIPLDEYCQ